MTIVGIIIAILIGGSVGALGSTVLSGMVGRPRSEPRHRWPESVRP